MGGSVTAGTARAQVRAQAGTHRGAREIYFIHSDSGRTAGRVLFWYLRAGPARRPLFRSASSAKARAVQGTGQKQAYFRNESKKRVIYRLASNIAHKGKIWRYCRASEGQRNKAAAGEGTRGTARTLASADYRHQAKAPGERRSLRG